MSAKKEDTEHIGLIYTVAFDLIENNEICRRHIGNTPDEYLGVGFLALQRAKRNYKSDFGVKFSTFATKVIKDQIIKAARRNSTLIKIATAYRYQAWRVANGKDQTQGSEKGVNAALRILSSKVVPLSVMGSIVGREEKEENWVKEEQINNILRRLEERTRWVIVKRFGLDGGEALTLDELGKMMQPPLSRERVRQIEKDGLKKLRKMLQA